MEHVLADGDPDKRVEEAAKKMIEAPDAELLTICRKTNGHRRHHSNTDIEIAKRHREFMEKKMIKEFHKIIERHKGREEEAKRELSVRFETGFQRRIRARITKLMGQMNGITMNMDIADVHSPPRTAKLAEQFGLKGGGAWT